MIIVIVLGLLLLPGLSRGRAVALELSRQGYRVYITCRSDLAGARETRDLLALIKKSAWDRGIDIHLNGFYNVTRPVVRQMI
jgi:NAD(P)-dependent dehydrogenase (short-subunit alcohol dehydrogenase family)